MMTYLFHRISTNQLQLIEKKRKKNNGGFKIRPTFSTGLALMNFFPDVLATRMVIKIMCALSIKYLHPEGQQCQIHKAVSLM
ncbi:hypothetical protein OIU79_000489 [Salix purpurea]|uniref:Uncharacterized protein n=1 Tax=Salix purpurea TaxID=77065 RepID=A0A9Q0ZN16_SALPP|nr:hypothetical protein OIU79_000489 [Salix purpurea]